MKIMRNCFLIALLVTCLVGCGHTSKLEWPSSGLSTVLLIPDSNVGKVNVDNDTNFSAEIDKYSSKQYKEYVNDCKDIGFTVDGKETDDIYNSYNVDGYKISLDYSDYDGEMDIDLIAPLDMEDLIWPETGLGKLLPIPVSKKGMIEYESSSGFRAYTGDTTQEMFGDYVEACKTSGFVNVISSSDDWYSAENGNGFTAIISYEGFNTMEVNIHMDSEETSSPASTPSSTSTSSPTASVVTATNQSEKDIINSKIPNIQDLASNSFEFNDVYYIEDESGKFLDINVWDSRISDKLDSYKKANDRTEWDKTIAKAQQLYISTKDIISDTGISNVSITVKICNDNEYSYFYLWVSVNGTVTFDKYNN